MTKPVAVSAGVRTAAEAAEAARNRAMFEANPASWETKLDNFPKYARRQTPTRFLALHELFKRVLLIKGAVIDLYIGFAVLD